MHTRHRGLFSLRITPQVTGLAILAAIGLAFAGYRSLGRTLPGPDETPLLSGIAPLFGQITTHERVPEARARIISVAAEGLDFSASFLRLDDDTATPVMMGSALQTRHESGYLRRVRTATTARIGGRWSDVNAGSRRSTPDDLSSAAALVFGSSFSSLFGKLFDPQSDRPEEPGDGPNAEDRNPFAEAKQREQAAGREVTAEAVKNPAPPRQQQEAQPTPPPQQDASVSAGGGVEPSRFVILGDLDGSGVLSAAIVERSGDTRFTFSDAVDRTFSLLINPAAIENQRSLALEDLDGDGSMDLLVTSRASLFGGILLGDAEGGFRVAGSFVTGYEPVLAAAGPQREQSREIVTVNLRSGVATAFRPEGNYRVFRANQLDFMPDYISHIIEIATGSDYLAAAQLGMQPRLYRWMPDGSFQGQASSLPAGPSLEVGADPRLRAELESIRVHQIGPYASVVLGNRAGQSFNVANLRISSQFFLVIGDLERRGNLDVAVGRLQGP